jgi:Sporulation related domain.
MRKAITIAAFAVIVCLLGGCDFFRVLAGRPTSREIEAKRMLILGQDTLSQQPATDPARPVLDLLPGEDTADGTQTAPQTEQVKVPKTEPTPPAPPANLGNTKISTRSSATFTQNRPEYRYYVMIGTFSTRENAVKLASRVEAAGYTTALIPFRSGLTAVGVCPSDDLGVVCNALEKLRSESFCPKDAWILNIE